MKKSASYQSFIDKRHLALAFAGRNLSPRGDGNAAVRCPDGTWH